MDRTARYLLVAILLAVPLIFVPEILSIFTMPKQGLLYVLTAALLLVLSRLAPPWPLSRALTFSLAAVLAIDLLAFVFSFDWIGAILGVYNFRLGIATHLGLAIAFVAAAMLVRTREDAEWLLLRSAPVLAAVFVYAVLQRAGLDPFEFSQDTQDHVISTLGNRNEMAAFALLTLVYAWPLQQLAKRRWPAWNYRGIDAAAIALALVLVVVEALVMFSQSRGAQAGLLLALGVLVLAIWNLSGFRPALRFGAGIAAVMLVGAIPHAFTGDLQDSLGRFGSSGAAVSGEYEADGTGLRRGLWVGTAYLLAERPVLGVGQSGYGEAFDRYRPEDLGEAWEASPDVARRGFTSPHNWVLEVAATVGIPGLIAVGIFAVLIVLALWRLHRRRESALPAYLAAALGGYFVAVLFNPFPIATLPTVAVFLGIVAGLTTVSTRFRFSSRLRRGAGMVLRPASVALLSVAVLFASGQIFLDWQYHEVASGDTLDDEGLDTLRRVTLLMPIEKVYRASHIAVLQVVGTRTANRQLIVDALDRQERYLRDFPGTGPDFVRLAELRFQLQEPGVEEALEDAHEADPYGEYTAAGIAQVEAAQQELEDRQP